MKTSDVPSWELAAAFHGHYFPAELIACFSRLRPIGNIQLTVEESNQVTPQASVRSCCASDTSLACPCRTAARAVTQAPRTCTRLLDAEFFASMPRKNGN